MAHYKSDFLHHIEERGFIFQGTDMSALDEKLCQGPVTAYIGFDATADSLHVGSLLPIMLLRWFQKTGNRPITLMGGGTTKIGDPSGKDAARQMLTHDKISENIGSISQIFKTYLNYGDGTSDAVMVNNADWLEGLNYIEFLRDYGRHFSINRMLTFEMVKSRLEREQPLSFLEFNYMLLQAYDFVKLAEQYDCSLQMGGSDQWGNIVSGIDLSRRILSKQIFGLTCPLLTTATGGKMGKTAEGAVWLSSDRLSPYDFWQFWRNTHDADVERFLKLFTELDMAEIKRLAALEGQEINEAKKILADEVTRLLHGEEAVQNARDASQNLFEDNGGGNNNLPSFDVAPDTDGVSVLQLLQLAGFAKSNGEARRLIRGGGARIQDKPVTEEGMVVPLADLESGNLKVSSGKKKHAIAKVKTS